MVDVSSTKLAVLVAVLLAVVIGAFNLGYTLGYRNATVSSVTSLEAGASADASQLFGSSSVQMRDELIEPAKPSDAKSSDAKPNDDSALTRNELATTDKGNYNGFSRVGAKYWKHHSEEGAQAVKANFKFLEEKALANKNKFVCSAKFKGWEYPSECNHNSTYWGAEILTPLLDDYSKIFKKRPLAKNTGGVNINHAFGLWAIIRLVRPKHIIESGVQRGGSTYFLREAAGPDVQIYSVDPASQSLLEFRDSSPNTHYLMGDKFRDFFDIDWLNLIPMEERGDTLIMYDDHQNIFKRLEGASKLGFGHVYYDDNIAGTRSHRPANTIAGVCIPTSRSTTIFKEDHHTVSHQEITRRRELMLRITKIVFDFPPIFDRCGAKDVRQLFRQEAEMTAAGLPSFADYPWYQTNHPPYIKLKRT